MRLVQCHIDGFGRITDADYNFDAGLNTFLRDNGWGKSTLAAFLRVMLYGFEGEGKRNELENERKKYLPWVGQRYGGSLTFSVDDKTYIVYRSFGSKAKEDTFKLIDTFNNLESNDFSERLGEELFQIDQTSFKRTAFMEQQDLETGGTDSISAKLSNLCEDTDDMNNFEKVKEFLTKSLNNMSPHRVTGSIHALNKEILDLSVSIREKEDLEKAVDELTTRINDKQSSGQAFHYECQGLKELELKLISQESRRAVRQKKADLLKEKESREEHLKQLKATIPGQIPDEDSLEEAKKRLRHFNNMELQLAEKKVTEEEAKRVEALDSVFSNGIPEDQELLTAERCLTEFSAISQKLEILESDLKLEQEKYTKEMHTMGQRLKRIHLRRVYGALIFLLFAIIEVVLFLNKNRLAAGVFGPAAIWTLAAGVVSLVVFFIVIEINYKRASKMPSSADRDRKEAEVLEAKSGMESRKNELNAFFSRYNRSCEPDGYRAALKAVEQDKQDYVRLSDKVTYAEKSGILQEKQESERKIQEFLQSTGAFLTGDYGTDLQNLSICRKEIENARAEYLRAEKNLRDFEDENQGYDDYQQQEEPSQYSLQEIRDKIQHIEENIKENDRLIKLEEKRRDDMLEQLEELNAKADLMLEKKEKLEELKHKYNTYDSTLKYLQLAHEELNSSLLAPLSDSFRGHLKEMGYDVAGNDPHKVFVDTHADVTIEEAGDRRDLRFFSVGTRDLVSVAMRVALLDNMYEKEMPFVVLDDPFVNLDDGRMSIAKEFLQSLSKKYQVVYFTCRSELV